METWIVADPEILAAFYGKGFRPVLPKRNVLDDEPKLSLYAALEAATKDTQKGSYGKIKHASELPRRLRPEVLLLDVPRFNTFTTWLHGAITGAA